MEKTILFFSMGKLKNAGKFHCLSNFPCCFSAMSPVVHSTHVLFALRKILTSCYTRKILPSLVFCVFFLLVLFSKQQTKIRCMIMIQDIQKRWNRILKKKYRTSKDKYRLSFFLKKKKKQSLPTLCLFEINLKTAATVRIFNRFSPIDEVVHEEGSNNNQK